MADLRPDDPCPHCGREDFDNVRCHVWQCSENPDAKTRHYERFQAQNRTAERQQAEEGAQQERQEAQDPGSSTGSGGVETRKVEVTHDPPADQPDRGQQASQGEEDEPEYQCPSCGAQIPLVKYCPECGVGPFQEAS